MTLAPALDRLVVVGGALLLGCAGLAVGYALLLGVWHLDQLSLRGKPFLNQACLTAGAIYVVCLALGSGSALARFLWRRSMV